MPKTLARGQGMAWMRKRAFIRGYAPSEGGGVDALTSAINGAVLTSAINGQPLTSSTGA